MKNLEDCMAQVMEYLRTMELLGRYPDEFGFKAEPRCEFVPIDGTPFVYKKIVGHKYLISFEIPEPETT